MGRTRIGNTDNIIDAESLCSVLSFGIICIWDLNPVMVLP